MSAPDYIQKALAHAGHGSRRQIEAWLRAGRICVNGDKAEPGQRLASGARVTLDGRPLRLARPGAARVLAVYKPEGVVCTRRDPRQRGTVFDMLPAIRGQRWISVGRLDLNTRGLLLFSNDGDLVQRLAHPSMLVEREYAVRVLGPLTPARRENMLRGVPLDGRQARFTDIAAAGGQGANRWYYVVLMEGRRREVRRIWEHQGFKVSRLIRVRYGSYILPRDKKPGECWELSEAEIKDILAEPEHSPRLFSETSAGTLTRRARGKLRGDAGG